MCNLTQTLGKSLEGNADEYKEEYKELLTSLEIFTYFFLLGEK